MIRAGTMRYLVSIQRRAAPATRYVKDAGDWITVAARRRASIKPIRGNEVVIAERLQGREIHSIMIRTESAFDDLSAAWRIVETDGESPESITKIYNIKHVSRPSLQRDFIVLTCVAGETDAGG